MGSTRRAVPSFYINVLLVAIFSFFGSNRAAAGPRLPFVSGYACYYGQPQLAETGKYPLAIIEASHYTREQIQQLKAGGTTVIAYLSAGEILEPSRAPKAPPPKPGTPRRLAIPPYYLDRDGDGQPDKNPGWGGFYVDARSPEWQARVLNELAPKLLTEKGADGVFLDTLDTVDAYTETKPGMIQLVKRLREKFPKAPIIANRGFTILEGLAPHIDAIMFEAFTTHYDPTSNCSVLHPASDLEWVDGVLARVHAVAKNGAPQVLVLDYADPKDPKVKEAAIRRAKASGLTYSISTGSLDKLPIDGGAGTPRK